MLNHNLLTKDKLQSLVRGGLWGRARYCYETLHKATWTSQLLFRLRRPKYRSSAEKFCSKHLTAGEEHIPQFWRMSPIWFYLCLVFRELASILIMALALPCDLHLLVPGPCFRLLSAYSLCLIFTSLTRATQTSSGGQEASCTPPAGARPSWYPPRLAKAQVNPEQTLLLASHLPSGSQRWVQVG